MRLKRVLGAVLSGAMVLSLAACGGGGDAETTAASKAEEISKEAAKETEAEKKDRRQRDRSCQGRRGDQQAHRLRSRKLRR